MAICSAVCRSLPPMYRAVRTEFDTCEAGVAIAIPLLFQVVRLRGGPIGYLPRTGSAPPASLSVRVRENTAAAAISRIQKAKSAAGNGCPLLKLTAKIHYNKMPAPSSDVTFLQSTARLEGARASRSKYGR